MASVSINMTFSTPNWAYTVLRAPTAGSGGTVQTLTPTTAQVALNQKDFIKVCNDALSTFLQDASVNGYATGSINITDTAGTFTFTNRRGGTAASGGTTVTARPTTDEAGKNTADLRKMLNGAFSAAKSDRAING